MRLGSAFGYAALGLGVALASLLMFAPASVMDLALDRATHGRLRLAETSGTPWRGQGRVVLCDLSSDDEQAGRVHRTLQGVVLPGIVRWRLSFPALLAGMLDATLEIDGMSPPLTLTGSVAGRSVTLSASSLEIPALDLGRLGSPWNTIRPSAAIALRWEDFRISTEGVQGRMTMDLRDAHSAMTPVRPLGSYRIDVIAMGASASVSLKTVSGALRLSGEGAWTARHGLRFEARAKPDPSERERLDAFLGLLGRRDGDQVLIRLGA